MDNGELGTGTVSQAEVAGQAAGHDPGQNHRAARAPLATAIEYICDFDIAGATGVNLSESGICFDVDESLVFEMQFVLDGERHSHRAELVRMEMLPDGRYRFGLKFAPEQS